MKLRIILSLLIILALASGCAKNQITASAIGDLPIEKQIEIEAKDGECSVLFHVYAPNIFKEFKDVWAMANYIECLAPLTVDAVLEEWGMYE